jgi:hypothetical protein
MEPTVALQEVDGMVAGYAEETSGLRAQVCMVAWPCAGLAVCPCGGLHIPTEAGLLSHGQVGALEAENGELRRELEVRRGEMDDLHARITGTLMG